MKIKYTIFTLLLALCINTNVKAQAVNVQDSLALVDFYNSTNGANWVNKTNWLTGPVKTWYGITVTDTRVTTIAFGFNNLKGTLPSSFGNLTGLNYLTLSDNYISGSIPSSFGNLVNLEYLYLIADELTGSIPSSLGNLVKLKELYFLNNQLSGNIPSEFGNLINLTELVLQENKLSGSIPDALSTLQKLNNLNLSDNSLSGVIPSSLGNLVNLRFLFLFQNQLSGIILSSLGNLQNIATVDLSDNSLTGAMPSSLGNLVHLQILNLSSNQLSGIIPSSLGSLSNLSTLYLDNNLLTGSIPSSLLNLKSIINVDMSHNKLRGQLIRGINKLTNLHSLNLSFNKLSGNISPAITQLPLSALNISYNHFTFDGMELIAQTFPFAKYNNQALIPVHQNGNSLAVSAGGTLSNNTYQWFKIGQVGFTVIIGDSLFIPSQSGQYYVNVANSVASQLTLKSDTINYILTDVINGFASSTNELKFNEKTSTFSVYPNPAKNILHIQTNVSASISVIDQSGKILFTTNINGNGTVDVSDVAAGLYYLKNTTTGELQKVIITK